MPLRTMLTLFIGLTLLAAPAPLWAAGAAPKDPDIARGLKLVEDGDFDDAIVALDTAVRRLAGDSARTTELAHAYLYLGIAYVAKGHETAAKAKFREALARAGDLSLSADRFAPKVVDIFEAARDEMRRSAPGAPAAASVPEKKSGSKTGVLLLGAGGAAAAGVAVVALGGGSEGSEGSTTFPNEVVVFGGGRDFVVEVKGSGTLTAQVDWQQDGVLLGMYIVNLANAPVVLADAGQTGSKQARLSLPVTPGAYRIAVTNSTGHGPQMSTTFTLTVTHP